MFLFIVVVEAVSGIIQLTIIILNNNSILHIKDGQS